MTDSVRRRFYKTFSIRSSRKYKIRGRWPKTKSNLLIYPAGAGGEFIGHSVYPLVEHNSDINRYEHLCRINQFLIIDGKELSEFIEFNGIDDHYFERVIDEDSKYLQYAYSEKFDIRKKLTHKSLKKIKRERGIDPLPIAPDLPIIVLHNHLSIHKFFPSITKAYCLTSNNYALRLIWAMCYAIKLDIQVAYDDIWFNMVSLIDDDSYSDLAEFDRPAYERYKKSIDIELITPAELDLIDDGLARKYKEYTERNIELISNYVYTKWKKHIKFFDKIEYI